MSLVNYESAIILTPVLSEAQMQEAVKSYRQLIAEHGGNMVAENNWGLTKLAYPIKKKSTGFYHFFEFQAKPEFIAQIETLYRRDERVLRFLNIKLDKHAVVFNEKKTKGEIAPAAKIVKEDAKI
ncbi:MAG: 30S ribosomal protein S6 [Bacteroidia bacterium]